MMDMKWMPLMIGTLFAAMTVGCSNTRTETYDVTVFNSLDKPVMVFLTKNGPPLEDGWWSPEDIAVLYGNVEDDVSKLVVGPGKQADSGPLKAKLAPGVSAVLRVYEGKHTLAELLSINRGSTDRIDVLLAPGTSNMVVNKKNGALTVNKRKH